METQSQSQPSQQQPPQPQPRPKKLYRSRSNRIIAGVCGGLGDYFDIDPIIFRILFVVLLLPGGAGFWIYLVLMIVVPNEPINGQGGQNPNRSRDFAEDVRQGANNIAKEIRGANNSGWLGDRRNLIGLIIVIVGVLILLNQILPFTLFRWDLFWPLVVILIGVMIISRRG